MRKTMSFIYVFFGELFPAFIAVKWLAALVAPLVANHVTMLRETLAADFTGKGLFSCVYTFVFRKAFFEFEASIAPRAVEEIALLVRALVSTEVTLKRKVLVADVTLVRFFSSMRSFVIDFTLFQAEGFFAIATVVWFFSSVDFFVQFQGVLLIELLATEFTHPRLQSSVREHMAIKIGLLCE